jgi:serine/threonine protein kinase
MLQPQQIIGQYQVVRFLGAGGMGAVYEVTHTGMMTRHALKVLGHQHVHSDQVRARFRREAQLMFQLGAHPNIVRATDLVESPDHLALVIDFIPGGDLAQALERRPGPLTWAAAWAILQPILSAVAFAHERQVVHRDLKPENVLLARDGAAPVPMVTDFGIARIIGSEGATRTNSTMGTACYGAPEQFRNAKDVGAEADVWALGMLAWRLVTGQLPVDPDDSVALIKVYEGVTPIPRLTNVPDHVANAIQAALSVDPSQRPRDARVLTKLLSPEAALDNASLQSAPRVEAPRSVAPVPMTPRTHPAPVPEPIPSAPRAEVADTRQMGFGEAVSACLGKYATFSGRARRSEYWWWTLFVVLVSFGVAVTLGLMFHSSPRSIVPPLVSNLVSLAMLLPGLAVSIRRLHDTGRSGWWSLISLTIVGAIPLFVWYCKPGDREPNRYGEPPA